jgi:hypothetical protein
MVELQDHRIVLSAVLARMCEEVVEDVLLVAKLVLLVPFSLPRSVARVVGRLLAPPALTAPGLATVFAGSPPVESVKRQAPLAP